MFQKHLEGIILEYFEHGDTNEVASALDEINLGNKRDKVRGLNNMEGISTDKQYSLLIFIIAGRCCGH